jgi:FixJ family two-component response regulator
VSRVIPIVYVIDPDGVARNSLARALVAAGMEVATYAEPAQCLREHDAGKCAVVVIDLADEEGIAILKALAARWPAIVLARSCTVELCRLAFKAGASEFLDKADGRGMIVEAVRQCVTCQVMLHARQRSEHEARERYRLLSLRERQVLGLLVAGLTNREIGRALSLSPRTIEVHRANLCGKLAAESLAHLVRQYAPLVEGDDL